MVWKDHLKLQGVVLLWGFTAVLGALILLPAGEIVVFRTGIGAFVLGLMLRSRLKIGWRPALSFFLTGLVIGAHWWTFFWAVKVANVSICMVGIATLSLWTAVLEPLMVKGRSFRAVDLLFGGAVLLGVAMIYRAELAYSDGILIAVLSAFLAAVFSVINSFHIKKANQYVITFYELFGGMCFAGAMLLWMEPEPNLAPTWQDWIYLLLLGGVCTVVAFSQYVGLLKKMTVFVINFASNLEPVYGILLAAWILKDYQNLSGEFYGGAAMIVSAVLLYPLVRKTWVLPK